MTVREQDRRLVLYGAALVLIVGLTQVRQLWAAQLLLVPLLLIVPGRLLLRALRVPGHRLAAFPLYVPAASLIVLMVSGLAVTLLVPLVDGAVLDAVFGPGSDPGAPLRPGPLLAGLMLVCLGLFLASVRAPQETAVPWRSLPSAGWLSLPLLLPLLAAAGRCGSTTGTAPRWRSRPSPAACSCWPSGSSEPGGSGPDGRPCCCTPSRWP